MEVRELTEGLAALALDSEVEVQRLFGLQIGISNNMDIYFSSRCMPPVKVEFARGRGTVGTADVRFEAQTLVYFVGCAELARHLAAEYVAVIPAHRRDDRPTWAYKPLILHIERGQIH